MVLHFVFLLPIYWSMTDSFILITKFECGKVQWKAKWLTTQAQANRKQHQAQIQIPNLNGRMTLLRIYSKPSVILRQWWSSRKFHRSKVDYVELISLHHLSFLHWCFTQTSFSFCFFFLCFNFLSKKFGITISE